MRTRWAKFSAAPDRWRRSRWAQPWLGQAPATQAAGNSVVALQADGFSPYVLDAQIQNDLLGDWRKLKASKAEGNVARTTPRSTGKMFFEELLADDDLRLFPAFFAAAIEERLLTQVLQAIGMVPHLESIDILASSQTGKELTASQLWHYDVNDVRIIKLFVYLEDCGARNGPFTFIPAGDSQRVAHAVGHYVQDDFIAGHVPRDRWRAIEGPAGTAFLIDTGRCYHFGSRCEATRYAYVVTYSSGLKFMRRARLWRSLVGARPDNLSPLQRRVCGLE